MNRNETGRENIVIQRDIEPIINDMQEAVDIIDRELKCVQQD